MKRRRLGWRLSAAFAVATIALSATAAPAFAHEARDVGAYHFLVGWGNEPAYAGQENSVQLVLAYLESGKPVVNLGTTLHVTVIFGSQSMVFGLEPTFDPDTGSGHTRRLSCLAVPHRAPVTTRFTSPARSVRRR